MLFLILFAAQDLASKVMGMPAPTAADAPSPWTWQLIVMFVSTLIATVSAAFAAWVKLREKKGDNETRLAAETAQANVDKLKSEFEAQERFRDSLQESLKESLEEGARLRVEIKGTRDEMRSLINENATLRAENDSLKSTLAANEKRIESLEKAVASSPGFTASDTMRRRLEDMPGG